MNTALPEEPCTGGREGGKITQDEEWRELRERQVTVTANELALKWWRISKTYNLVLIS